jgi:hypothetical protein
MNVFDYIKQEETNWKTAQVPLTRSKSWNMYEHIERCTNVANAWFHQGGNDINDPRPYDDIVTPIINVAFRSEGFDVKDIIPYVDDVSENYKSFLVKKYHPQWARKNELDTFIDEVVETSIIYDLVLAKNVNNVRPEVVDLKTLAFCDQTNVLAGPLCFKHQYTPAELVEYKSKWDSDAIDLAITLAVQEIEVSIAGDRTVKTPGKYIEVYELRGNLPETWDKDVQDGDKNKFTPQMHIVCYYHDKGGKRQGITLYAGKDKPLSENFKALKIDGIKSKGRACGRSIVESLFQPQTWRNYDGIKLKKMLDAAVNLLQTDSEEYGNQKLSELKELTILKHEPGRPITRVDGNIQNLPAYTNDQIKWENSARVIGSASDAQLGTNPVSGTPFALQNLVVQQGQGIHEYRQGKIATFFADVLYPAWILPYLVNDMNQGKNFSEELSLDELQEIANQIGTNKTEAKMADLIFAGKVVTPEIKAQALQMYKEQFAKNGSRGFFKVIKDELKDIPTCVYVNIKGKQKNMAANADKLSNLISKFLQAGVPISGMSKAINQLLEESGLSPIDFTQIVTAPAQPAQSQQPNNQQPQPQLQQGQ